MPTETSSRYKFEFFFLFFNFTGSTVKIKPQKYRCGVCKQDFSDPRQLFKHMNHVHINASLQQQIQQQQQQAVPQPPATPTPPPQQPQHHHHQQQIQIQQQQAPPPLVPSQQATLTTTDNVVYTNLSTDNIYYDERTGHYYTIQLMDHSPPLAETPGSQSVIEYVHDSSGLGEGTTVEYVTTDDTTGETIIVKEEATKVVIAPNDGTTTHHHHHHVQDANAKLEPPPPLVQITRETDLEELIPTTTLVAADETPNITVPLSKAKQTAAELKASQLAAQQQLTIKCVNCNSSFVKKFPKQMYCHTCVARNTHAKH